MKFILLPCSGINHYPAADIIVKRCKVITLDIIQRTFAQYHLLHNPNESIGVLTPRNFKGVLEHITYRYDDVDCFVLEKNIEQLFVMPAPLYGLECSVLKSAWIPESWKTIES